MPRVRWDGDATSAIRAQEALTVAQKKYREESQKSTLSAKQLEAQAKRIAEQVNPQEKYNRKMAELAILIDKGKLSTDNARLATEKYQRELEHAGATGSKAFGAAFISSLTGAAAGFLSIGKAINVVGDAIREAQERAKAAGDASFRSRLGLGSLSQLAADPNPAVAAANFKSLVAEARGFVSIGAAIDENEGGNLLFELASAGLGRRDRAFAARVRAAGTLVNVGGIAGGFDALTKALGSEEVGTFEQFLSKALQAAKTAPGSFEGLPIALTRAGGSAKALGVSDEFLFAAGSILARQANSPEEGGTLLAAFLRGVEKSGLTGVQGVGGVGIIERLSQLPAKQQGFGGVLGERAEAVAAFRTLRDNLQELRGAEAGIFAAQDTGLAGVASGLPSTDPQLRAANSRAIAEGRQAVTVGGIEAERQNLLNAVAARRASDRSKGGLTPLAQGALDLLLLPFRALTPPDPRSELQLAVPGLDAGDPLRGQILDYLRRSASASESTARQQRSKVVTRSE